MALAQWLAAAVLPAAFAGPAGAQAPDPARYGKAFVDAFAAACVPERLSYEGTKTHAESLGWTPVEPRVHPELDAMMTIARSMAADPEMETEFAAQAYAGPVAEAPHYLVVSRASFVIGEPDDPLNPWVYVGCYLYNFDATGPIDPAPVTALIGKPVAQEMREQGLVSQVWGPPCPMPRTGDTYLTFIAEHSPLVRQTGFSGLMMKFETSLPDPGETVPETYC